MVRLVRAVGETRNTNEAQDRWREEQQASRRPACVHAKCLQRGRRGGHGGACAENEIPANSRRNDYAGTKSKDSWRSSTGPPTVEPKQSMAVNPENYGAIPKTQTPAKPTFSPTARVVPLAPPRPPTHPRPGPRSWRQWSPHSPGHVVRLPLRSPGGWQRHCKWQQAAGHLPDAVSAFAGLLAHQSMQHRPGTAMCSDRSRSRGSRPRP